MRLFLNLIVKRKFFKKFNFKICIGYTWCNRYSKGHEKYKSCTYNFSDVKEKGDK